MTAGFGAFLTASDPALQIANAEIEARKALEQYGYDWAKVRIAGNTAIITGTAPTEAERIIAYQAVRGALHQAMVEEDMVSTIISHLALAEHKPNPGVAPAKIATAAEPLPVAAPIQEAQQQAQSVTEAAPIPAGTHAPAQETSPRIAAVPDQAPVEAPVTSTTAANEPAPKVFTPEPVAEAPVATLASAPQVIAAATPAPTVPKPTPVVETSAITKPAAATATGCKAQFSQTLSNSKIAFGIDSAKIEKSSDELLDTLSGIARHCGHFKLTVEGHTDLTGRTAYNRSLSQRRANAVRAALIARGIAKDKIVAKGYGASKPIVTGETEVAYAQNRRIEISVSEPEKVSVNAPHAPQGHAKK